MIRWIRRKMREDPEKMKAKVIICRYFRGNFVEIIGRWEMRESLKMSKEIVDN
jgi:hypothetical protein